MIKMAFLAGVVLAVGVATVSAQTTGKLAAAGAPAGLESYTDTALVIENARRVIGILATATFSVETSDGRKGNAECNSEQVLSFNRGYLLAHTGFNMFLALQERGFTDLTGPNGLPHASGRRFVQFGRAALLGAWTLKRLNELLDVRVSLRSLPQATKADLAAFLAKLRDYRVQYARLKAAKRDFVEELIRREDDAYYWYDVAVRDSGPTFAEQQMEMPKGVGYDELSKLLDKELREISDIGKSDPHACFVEHSQFVIAYPTEKLRRDYNPIYATKYMITFWRRREMEGTSEVAGYVIDRVLEALRSS